MSQAAGAAWGLVLAAGGASRFGGPKLLAQLKGRPLAGWVAAAVRQAIEAGDLGGAVAVTPSGGDALARIFAEAGIEPVVVAGPGLALSHSLACGLEALAAPGRSPRPAAAVVILSDQPLLRAQVVHGVVAAWRSSGRSVRARYAAAPDRLGHPVVLDRSLWPLAAGRHEDRGLGPLLRERPDVITVEFPGTNPDVDRPEDLLQIEGPG